ncbi:component of SufBCD complex [Algirhabdus cladophorae]|uniref:component of SufBCD complex n=1 Tax=Algirhabdus cladophorae TaxID=3377108 RepID=UPI003B84725A
MDWYTTVIELIDMRSFSNLWYWIALAVVWSSASHWVLGVPFDLVLRARRHGGQAELDLEDLVRINTNRLVYIGTVSGLWLLGFSCFFLTGLGLLGFFYGVEFAQAVFLLAFPMSIVALMSISTSRLISTQGLRGEALRQRMTKHRFFTQLIGVLSIFVTAMWGMYQNMTAGALGG